ncbi:hypothetical protein [Geothrix sp. PMB-07]|uniref:hypothetical protein n=1 Tax=Geothrix sp. PMB-07 TaxID=3068640 RepID=UPI002742536C|nr:hypothetical protein [Geothrix sp. PMB-07]WLT30412.1 hypothetical protein Q9293_11850 [Geothrix sp. PMB-07]
MSDLDNPEEAIYTLHFLSELYPPARMAGLKQIRQEEFAGKLFVSEWLIIKPEFQKIEKRLPEFRVKMMQLRIHKPDNEKWCIVDWKLLRKAIDHGYAVAV